MEKMELKDGWIIQASVDDDSHLNVFITNNDGSKILDISEDNTNDNEMPFRLTSEKIENEYLKGNELQELVKIEQKYYQSDKLKKRIDWDNIMKMSRCAGGHDEQMQGLLKDVTILGHWNEGDYQGYVATCVQLNDTGEIVIYNDSYGSCSGCDAWEDATDQDVKEMCEQLSCSAYIFKNLEDCKEFLGDPDKERSFDWAYSNVGLNLLNAINNHEVE